ncbi:MAG: cadmium-translocating P-type ATPase [Acidobacteriia bacterium]|nr:cadmium-translocating P-type ATPase [Terriglobia bacterium]
MHSPQPRVTAGSAVDLKSRNDSAIAVLAIAGIATHLFLRFVFKVPALAQFIPLYISLILGGVPLVFRLIRKILLREFGSDLLAGLSIVVAVLMGQYLVGTIVVLMLSGGTALENFAARRASSVLEALASRMPQTAHRKTVSGITDIEVAEIAVGDALVVFPHEICPVDGMVLEGQGRMNEAYLTGEPFEMSKTPGSEVLSGAVNGETALTIRAGKLATDSRYAKIMQVMQVTQQRRPRLRRLGDMLGAWYTPLAITLALVAWIVSGESHRFLAVLVIATPCPLLLAIPVAVIGAISLSARHSIIIKNPAVLEQIGQCATLIFDKTGTLTYGRPAVTEILCASGRSEQDILRITASLERYSKHPLASAILEAASRANITLDAVTEVSEKQGEGLRGTVGGRKVWITGRGKVANREIALPIIAAGLECLVFVDGEYAATLRFHDIPRIEGRSFMDHLRPRHHVNRVLLVSGDRDSEVRYLADLVGIKEIHASQSPEEKVSIVQRETRSAKTLFVGDGINDAPAMQAATVGVAFGVSSDITAEAADAVILEASLGKVDELMHIGQRMRAIALLSAVGGMALSVIGMIAAAFGLLLPIEGAIAQEVIDLAAVLNALRVAFPFDHMTDF